MPGPAVITQGLTREFGQVRALDGLDLEVPAGVVFGFLGPNGSGKTTTIRLLLGLLNATSGSARVLGHDVSTDADEVRARSGALMEHNGLYERLTAEENLRFFARAWRLPAEESDRRVRELLGHLGLWERRGDLVGMWSRGMKQKLAVARALLHRPRLVFLDEPTAGLDPIAAAEMRDDLAALVAEEGTTVFITTHNLAEAERLCGLLGVIRVGRLLAVDTPARLRAAAGDGRLEVTGSGFDALLPALRVLPGVRSAEVREGALDVDLAPGAAVPDVVAFLVERGGRIEEVRRGAASLEEAFLSLVGEAS